MENTNIRKINLDFDAEGTKKKLDKNHVDLVSRIEKGQPIIGSHPINVQIQTVSTCNAKCMFCPYVGSWHQKNPGIMNNETFEQIIKSLSKYEVHKLCPYLENEPLVDKKIFQRLEYMVQELKPLWVEFATNLSLLTDEMLNQIKELFPKIKHVFWISFHGINKETYEDIMGLDYEKTLGNIHKLIELTQDIPVYLMINGSGEPSIEGELKTWFTEEQYYDFWKEQLKNYKKKPKVRYFKYHDRAGQIQLREKGLSYNKIFRSSLEDFYCNRFDKWVHFLYNGDPIMCCMDYNRETVISLNGNSSKTIENVYNSPEFVNMIRKSCGMDESEPDFICKRCTIPIG